jgi:hypothetical protein
VLRFLPGKPRSPKWVRTFIQESNKPNLELNVAPKRQWGTLSVALLATSAIGLVFQMSTAFYPALRVEMVFPAAVWAVACFILAICRPATTPMALLVLYVALLISQLIVLVDGSSQLRLARIPGAIATIAAFTAICIILVMPLRNPLLPTKDISPPFEPPDKELRSPEDNLTLWQFMTVSWMAPLISLGNKRQLNDEDVWSLGYEFQHRGLHDSFRQLEGSVLGRLLEANGLDLLIISVLGILELSASKLLPSHCGGISANRILDFSAPVLLQKILQSMENPAAPKQAAVNYAVLSLVVRLIACQSAVLTLWYGRRAYERSRGELITMLYEKTLHRKVVSVSSKAIIEINTDTISNGVGKHEQPSRTTKVLNLVLAPWRWACGSRKKATENKDIASMGKIMNLMRFDAYEVAQRFWEFSSIVTQPLSLIFSVVLIWQLLGWPCLIGATTVVLAQVINVFLAKAQLHWERERRTATDNKLQKITQLVDAIRHLRYYGWQDVWLSRIMESRQHELKLRIITSIWRTLITFSNTLASGLFPVAAFWAYTLLAGKPLTIDIAFPALQLFSMMERSLRDLPNLITVNHPYCLLEIFLIEDRFF